MTIDAWEFDEFGYEILDDEIIFQYGIDGLNESRKDKRGTTIYEHDDQNRCTKRMTTYEGSGATYSAEYEWIGKNISRRYSYNDGSSSTSSAIYENHDEVNIFFDHNKIYFPDWPSS